MNKKDLMFVIAVLKGERILCEPDWFSVLGFLQYHRIGGLFYNQAKQLGICLPAKVSKLLFDVYQSQVRRTEYIRQHLKELSQSLINEHVAHVLLKGSVLSNLTDETLIYSDGERVSNDIDILVKPDGISAVSDVLKKLGYIQGTYNAEENEITPFSRMEILKRRMNRGETAPFLRLTGIPEFPFIEVDINFSLGNIPGGYQDLLTVMIDERSIYHGKVELSVTNEELFFLHLIMHQFKESNLYFMVERGKDLDLYKLVDIYYLWKENIFDKELFDRLVEKYRVQKEVGAVLGQVGRIFDDESLQHAANQYGDRTPEIIDYNNKRTYVWTVDEKKRLCKSNASGYLKEVSK